MISENDKRSYLRKLRNKEIDGIQKREILKQLNVACKKVSICPYCAAINGSVKKTGALMIIHEKFKKKKNSEEILFKNSFQNGLFIIKIKLLN